MKVFFTWSGETTKQSRLPFENSFLQWCRMSNRSYRIPTLRSYRYCLGPYRKRRGHVKGSAGAQRKGVAAVVSIRCDEGSLSGLAGSCYAF